MEGLTNGYGYGFCYGYKSPLQLILLILKQSTLQLEQDFLNATAVTAAYATAAANPLLCK